MALQKLLQNLKNKHFLSISGNGAMAVFSMITIAILLRYMPAKDIGYWFFFQSAFVLLDTFRTGFLQVALIKFYSGAEDKKAETVLGSVWYLGIVITLILVAINLLFLLGLPFLNNLGITIIIKWFGITFLCTLPSAITSWILQSDQKFGKLLVLRVISQVIFFLMLVMLIILKSVNLNYILLINALSAFLASIFCFLKKWSKIKTIIKRSKQNINELLHFGKYSVSATISTNLLRSSDTFIIMFVLGTAGPAAVAMYSIPMRLMEIIEIPLRSFLATGMPALSEAFNKSNKKEVSYIMQKYAGILTLALIPVCLFTILLADFIIGLFGGGKYSGTNAVVVYRIFLSFAMFYPIDRFLGVTLDIIHKPRINFFKILVMLATNIIFDFVGIYLFGNINGVALATFFTFLSGVFFGYYWLRKYLPFTIIGIFKTGYDEWKILIKQFLLNTKIYTS